MKTRTQIRILKVIVVAEVSIILVSHVLTWIGV